MKNREVEGMHGAMKKSLGIYIHIPFCIKKCAYCDFLSMPATLEVQKEYVEALIREIESYKTDAKYYEVQTIYFGGGTPSILEAGHIEHILNAIYDVFQVQNKELLEITLEVNPGTVTMEKWMSYKMFGINRISMGLQSTDNDELQVLGRIHTYEEFLNSFKMAREVGFYNINVDVMSALPGQTLENYKKSLENVVNLSPEHISSYSLIVEEGTRFWEDYREGGKMFHLLPDEETERKMYLLTKEVLEKSGYSRYEISNYAKNGMESKHNSSYWMGVPYIGIGVGASSYLDNQRYQNKRDIKQYILYAGFREKRICDIEVLSKEDMISEFMFLGLRRMCGVSKKEFFKRFQISMEEVYGDLLRELAEQKLLIYEDEKIYLTDYGIDVSNYVFSKFLL